MEEEPTRAPTDEPSSSLADAARAAASRLAAGPAPRVVVSGLRGPARAAFAAALVRERPSPLLFVVDEGSRADEVARDLRFFLGEEPSGDALGRRVQVFPAWDVPPFSPTSPSAETVAQRIEGLWHLAQTPNLFFVASADAVLQRVVSPAVLRQAVSYLVQGDDLDLDAFAARLAGWGYRRRPLVEERGEFAVRGGLVDVFATGSDDPVRLELLGDTIESIRCFDPRTQRRVADREEALVLPAAEFPTAAMRDPVVARRIEDRTRELEMTRADRHELADALAEGRHFPGFESLASYLFELVPLASVLPAGTVVLVDDEEAVGAAFARAWEGVLEHEALAVEERRAHAPAADLHSSPEDLARDLAALPRVVLDEHAPGAIRAASRAPELHATRLLREERGFAALASRLREWTDAGRRTALVVGNAAQAERLLRILERAEMPLPASGGSLPRALEEREQPGAFVLEGELTASVELPGDGLVCIAETNLFGEHRHGRRRKAVALTLDQVMRSLEQLSPDDHVVHLDHGIGLYRGLRHMAVTGTEGDFLELEYQGGDRLFLPVDRVNLVQKYVGGDGANPLLDKLGGVAWAKAKAKAKESILAMAHELLALYATRAREEGHSFSTGDAWYQEFEARFPFDETPDQQRAIDEVLADLGSAKPMDRLVCGDVGYGKTEVAMRAAFVCAMEGRQVAILVPTTVLAQQHAVSFRRRFAGYPVRIETMSGFRTRNENAEVAAGLTSGEVDLVVGTHRLLQPDVKFARLGLLVVDEEHRFGVRDKERIKQLRKTVDVLTLTAAPIPRTLELSLTGIRDLSVIETPPLDRQAIRTYVTRFDDAVVRE
ncbi:MAG: DEAD/DEAH box helicase, partial [Alphaproteobacteria bacterium]